ncbi:Zn-dependent hydrolase of the beta-lactamase fold-like protein [Thermodesulfobium narugense DSM 14796]|uniref:Zn-dependent hydrolase of the beta-lactamase fold-like protein n=1 Tax=Thermodesulfobium narugense DSM 14796 TaxID=747365 RepID=M1E521_9BACT|nr:MBL fold metallo-hydrolase [Thermodesulfobium narugense]AEE14752.1 Zn-dependent hydrolase of the beta-lactamase fold-like protein [Thermodesulfobium narugense DSM 14796]
MKIEYFGHSCFVCETKAGTRFMFDPFNEKVGYPLPSVPVDVVFTSHDHFDHNAVNVVKGNPKVFKDAGKFEFKDLSIEGHIFNHDDNAGKERGKVVAFKITADGVSLAHMGDLGEVPSKGSLKPYESLDLLLIPVGGFYTIGPDEVLKIVDMINPKQIVPMHYKLTGNEFPIKTLNEFLAAWKYGVNRINSCKYEITPGNKEKELVVMKAVFEK